MLKLQRAVDSQGRQRDRKEHQQTHARQTGRPQVDGIMRTHMTDDPAPSRAGCAGPRRSAVFLSATPAEEAGPPSASRSAGACVMHRFSLD